MHHINDPSLSIGFHLDIYHSHQGHHINDPSLSIGFHLDIYHSHQGHHIMIHLYQLVSTWTSIILIKGIISMIHLYQLVSTWTSIILINAYSLFINHQSINYLTSINDINQTKPFTSMTYDPTISQIIKPLASMTT
jgi:hypothetical protein